MKQVENGCYAMQLPGMQSPYWISWPGLLKSAACSGAMLPQLHPEAADRPHKLLEARLHTKQAWVCGCSLERLVGTYATPGCSMRNGNTYKNRIVRDNLSWQIRQDAL